MRFARLEELGPASDRAGLADDLIIPILRVDTVVDDEQIIGVNFLLDFQQSFVIGAPLRMLPIGL